MELEDLSRARARRARPRVAAARSSPGPRRHAARAHGPARARRWSTSRSRSGWPRARSTRCAPSGRCSFGDGDVPDDPEEHPARHRRAAPLHGLPLPGRRRRTTASSGSRTAARCSTSNRWARTTCTACATRSKTRRSTRPRARRTRTRRCGRSTARRAFPPTGPALPLDDHDRSRRSRRSTRTRTVAIVEQSKIATHRDRGSPRPAASRAGRLGRLLPATSIPTSSSKTSHTARW